MRLALATLPAIAYATDPLSVSEMDAHSDAARLWATIERVREEMREEMEEVRAKVRELQTSVADEAMAARTLHNVLGGTDPVDDRSDEECMEHVMHGLLGLSKALYQIAKEDV